MDNTALTYHITYGLVIVVAVLTKLGQNRVKAIRLADNKPVIVDSRLLSTSNTFIG